MSVVRKTQRNGVERSARNRGVEIALAKWAFDECQIQVQQFGLRVPDLSEMEARSAAVAGGSR
jgi:hypothetical protein